MDTNMVFSGLLALIMTIAGFKLAVILTIGAKHMLSCMMTSYQVGVKMRTSISLGPSI